MDRFIHEMDLSLFFRKVKNIFDGPLNRSFHENLKFRILLIRTRLFLL